MDILVGFGDRLKRLRKNKHISQATLGKAMGLSRSAIRNWEVGYTKPCLEDILRLALYFEVTTDFLLCMDGNRTVQLDFLTDRAFMAVSTMIQVIKEDHILAYGVKTAVNQV